MIFNTILIRKGDITSNIRFELGFESIQMYNRIILNGRTVVLEYNFYLTQIIIKHSLKIIYESSFSLI